MVANERFTFDTNQKGPNINLTNSSKTAVKQLNDGGYEIVLGTIDFFYRNIDILRRQTLLGDQN